MTRAHFDAQAGASGNMILGALLDAGLDQTALEDGLRCLDIGGWQLVTRRVKRGAIGALHADFAIEPASDGHAHRTHAEIDRLIADSSLADLAKARARGMFERLAAAEAAVHGVEPSEVTFHEVGAVDSILDIVGAALAVDLLKIDEVSASRLNVGGGRVQTQHGEMPVPAPATVRLLENSGAETYSTTQDAELLTPTGALVLTSLATSFGPQPPLRIRAHGYGAGTRELPFPNVLRVTLGDGPALQDADEMTVLETNIDDMNPEAYPHVSEALFAADAVDVFTTPVGMKKGRPGTRLSAIVPTGAVEAAVEILMRETTTLGVRAYDVRRYKLPRHSLTVQTPYGPIRVKAAYLDGRLREVAPEYDDCHRAAVTHAVPLGSVYDAARSAGRAAAPARPPGRPATEGASE